MTHCPKPLQVGVGGQRKDEGVNEYGMEDSLRELGQLVRLGSRV